MTDAGDSHAAVERVWQEAHGDPKAALQQGLNPSDLTTVLLDVARNRASVVSPARLATLEGRPVCPAGRQ